MKFSQVYALASASIAVVVNGQLDPRDDSTTPFQIYAYGPNIGGVPVFSSGQNAFIGDFEKLNNSQAVPIIFTQVTSNNTWAGAPNTTAAPDPANPPTWDKKTFGLPSASSGSNQVGFVTSANSTADVETTRFNFYGSFVTVLDSNGQMQSGWYAVLSDTKEVYALKWSWNTTQDDGDGRVLLTLKTSPPSN